MSTVTEYCCGSGLWPKIFLFDLWLKSFLLILMKTELCPCKNKILAGRYCISMLSQEMRRAELDPYSARCLIQLNKRQMNKNKSIIFPKVSKELIYRSFYIVTFFGTFEICASPFDVLPPTLAAKAKWSGEWWPLLSQSSTADIFTSNDGDGRWTGPEGRVYADTLDSLWASIIAPPEATRCVQTLNVTLYICVCVCDRMGMCLNLMAKKREADL